jgi:DNA-binding transcriptional regulator YiaG
MTPAQLRAFREQLGLTQTQAGFLIGVEGRTWRKWENSERGIPTPIARLVRLCKRPEIRDQLLAMARREAST